MAHRLPPSGILTALSEHFEFYHVTPKPERPKQRREDYSRDTCGLRPRFIAFNPERYGYHLPNCGYTTHNTHKAVSECCMMTCCRENRNEHRSSQAHCLNTNRLNRSCDAHPTCAPLIYHLQEPCQPQQQEFVMRCGCHDMAGDHNMDNQMAQLGNDIRTFDARVEILDGKCLASNQEHLMDPCQPRPCYKRVAPKQFVYIPVEPCPRTPIYTRPYYPKIKSDLKQTFKFKSRD